MERLDPIQALAALLENERGRVVRLWSKRLRAEIYEVEVPSRELKEPLDKMVSELTRLLRLRGREAVRLWPEVVRSHGALRYEQRFDAEDLTREFKALLEVLLHVYARRHGGVEPVVAELTTELVGEGLAAAMASFTRVLKTEEVRFREAAVMESVLHHVDVGILLADVDGTVTFATPPVQRLMGTPMRTVVGAQAVRAWEPVLAQVKARHMDGARFKPADMPFMRALRERGPVRGEMMRVDRMGGAEAILEMTATPIFEEDGELAGVLQTLTDQTEPALNSRALLDAYGELRLLQGRLLQRTRSQALGQLAQGAAHALNNYLNTMRLRLTLLRREFKPEHVDALDKSVGQIGELVNRLQEFGIQRGEEKLVDAGLDDMLQEALELARPDLDPHQATLKLETSLQSGTKVRVDAGFFREMMVNLLTAAAERMGAGGTLKVSSSRDGSDGCGVAIEDSGPPYSEAELAQLFDPLYRPEHSPQLPLVLAVARAQVQRWGGELTMENQPTEGTILRLRLPQALPPAQRDPEGDAESLRGAHARFQKTRRVLVVDDDLDNAQILAEVLEDEGYEVQVAPSGDVALRMWEAHRYDAALLDALMPDMSGWELARMLRQRSPQVLLAIVTGLDVRGQNRLNLALVDAIFRKPVDVGALDEFLSQTPPWTEAPAGGEASAPSTL